MPNKPRRPCSYSGCPELVSEQYCDKHKKEMDARYNKYEREPESNKRYGRNWRRIRERYIAEHPLCEECLKDGKLTPAEQVHHLYELREGGNHDFNNLRSLCKSHHSSLHLRKRNETHDK